MEKQLRADIHSELGFAGQIWHMLQYTDSRQNKSSITVILKSNWDWKHESQISELVAKLDIS
jgi:hypothetical protein